MHAVVLPCFLHLAGVLPLEISFGCISSSSVLLFTFLVLVMFDAYLLTDWKILMV